MVVGVGCFKFFLAEGASDCRSLVSITLKDVLVLGRLFCLTSTLACDVYLWGDSCGVVLYVMISANLLMACNLLDPMDAIGAVVAEFAIAYIKYSATLVAAY